MPFSHYFLVLLLYLEIGASQDMYFFCTSQDSPDVYVFCIFSVLRSFLEIGALGGSCRGNENNSKITSMGGRALIVLAHFGIVFIHFGIVFDQN